jgi:hypothetical protein
MHIAARLFNLLHLQQFRRHRYLMGIEELLLPK